MPARIIPIARLKILARLRRVDEQLVLWDELEAAEYLPYNRRPHLPVPAIDRERLGELRAELVAALGELDARSVPT